MISCDDDRVNAYRLPVCLRRVAVVFEESSWIMASRLENLLVCLPVPPVAVECWFLVVKS